MTYLRDRCSKVVHHRTLHRKGQKLNSLEKLYGQSDLLRSASRKRQELEEVGRASDLEVSRGNDKKFYYQKAVNQMAIICGEIEG